MPLIILALILIIGGIGIAFGVSIWGAILILLGIVVFGAVVLVVIEAIKNEKGKKIVIIVSLVLVVALCLFILVRCFGGTSSDDGWVTCLKCGGDGRYQNSSGYNVTCPRCNGVGSIPR